MDKFLVKTGTGNKKRKGTEDESAPAGSVQRLNTDASSSSQSATAIRPTGNWFPNDIGQYVNKTLSNSDKRTILLNCWTPPLSYTFPSLKFGKQQRSFQRHWLDEFKWLAYSDALQGSLCKWCVAFASETVTRSAQTPGALVSIPYANYKKAKDYYLKHQNCKYHEMAATLFENFVFTTQDPENDIQNILVNSRLKTIGNNRKRLLHIIRCIEFCGRQELPLRGHRDSGPLTLDAPNHNEGNFRAALRLRLECLDKETADLFFNSPRNASYLSWKVQNDIISIMGSQIQNQILCDIAENKYFAILADETSDENQEEQLSISIRFVKDNAMYEEFICFVAVSSTTGENLASTILSELSKLGLNLDHLRGQGYDGASNMSGKVSGVQARVKELYPLAMYTHCSSHVFNLSINSGSKLRIIDNTLSTIGDVCTFLSCSPHRVHALQDNITTEVPTASHQRLKPLCPTRWVERHDSIIIFLELFPAIVKTLRKFQEIFRVSDKATSLLNSIEKCSFVVACFVLEKFSGLFLPLSKMLQKKDLDIFSANELIESLIKSLEDDRADGDVSFGKVFEKVQNVCQLHEIALICPRRATEQIYRENYSTDDVEVYYRQSIYVPYIDHLIMQMTERFADQRIRCQNLWCLIPKYIVTQASVETDYLLELYQQDIDSSVVTVPEISRWREKWKYKDVSTLPANAVEALRACNVDVFPNVRKLLIILATLPVTSATSERSFSTLRRLKTYLRKTMGEERLTGLALLAIHHARSIDKQDVLNEYATSANRRSEFVL